jgi:hypothetical protein
VVQPAMAAPNPTKPKKMLYLFGGLVLGLLGVMARLLYVIAYRRALITAESVERILRIPVLATTPLHGDLARSGNKPRRIAKVA